MHEHDFDEMLKNTMPELPPEDVVRRTVPWRRPMNHILIGLALCTLTLRFLALQYILPTIGMILLLLGFRSLRSENLWFRICQLVTILHVTLHFFTLILGATIYHSTFYASPYNGSLRIVNAVSQVLLYLCFWRGIAAVQKKADMKVHAKSALALLIWYFALAGLALLQYQGWILAVAMVICFILVIRSLFCLSHALDESGYALKTAPVRISDNCLMIVLVAVLLAGLACGYRFGGSYHMDWQKSEGSPTAEIASIKENLLSLGYPEAALIDLSDEDILMCKNACAVVVNEEDISIKDSRAIYDMPDDSAAQTNSVYKMTDSPAAQHDMQNLHMTSVMVELGDGSSMWRIFHHFQWTADPDFYGTEALEIWPAYRDCEELISDDLSGRILYDNKNGIYVSSFHSLTEESYLTDDIAFGNESVNAIWASFSFPHDSERQRGYVAYGMEVNDAGRISSQTYSMCLTSQINYVHQCSMFQYPAETAVDHRRHHYVLDNSDTFLTLKNGIMFEITITIEGLEPSDINY